jgi:penicillin-binding protein 1C
MLQSYRVPKFYSKLQMLELSRINCEASTYGLSLIIGGGESSLQEMCHAYLGIATRLKEYTSNSSLRDKNVMRKLHYVNFLGTEKRQSSTVEP